MDLKNNETPNYTDVMSTILNINFVFRLKVLEDYLASTRTLQIGITFFASSILTLFPEIWFPPQTNSHQN